tara:strand:+ start:222 stop:509 length:288 start_codon:yes stop_codon:yes gene_type:complete
VDCLDNVVTHDTTDAQTTPPAHPQEEPRASVAKSNVQNAIDDTIKRMYIREKKSRNERKIKKVLGVKVDYSTYKTNPKKIRNFLCIHNNDRIKQA